MRTLYEVEQDIKSCRKCELCKNSNYVFGQGDITSSIMVIGESAGEDEERTGIPLVGKSGQLFTKILHVVNICRDEVYFCNIIKARPPNNRNPHKKEIKVCLPYLLEQIEIVSPEIIILLGNIALESILGKKGITKYRGKWFVFNDIAVIPMYHPSYILRNEGMKEERRIKMEVWNDIKLVEQKYRNLT